MFDLQNMTVFLNTMYESSMAQTQNIYISFHLICTVQECN